MQLPLYFFGDTHFKSSQSNQEKAKVEKFSNGFKIGGNDSISNENGTEYLYITFGQSLVGLNNVPCTAR